MKTLHFKYTGSSFHLWTVISKVTKEQNKRFVDHSIDSFLYVGKIKAHERACPI